MPKLTRVKLVILNHELENKLEEVEHSLKLSKQVIDDLVSEGRDLEASLLDLPILKKRLESLNDRLSAKCQDIHKLERELKGRNETVTSLTKDLFRAKGYIDRVNENSETHLRKLSCGDNSIVEFIPKGPKYNAE